MIVVLLSGDGVGREISKSVKDVSRALRADIDFVDCEGGAEYYEKTGELFEKDLFDQILKTGVLLKGPTATPIGKGFRSINVQLRQQFETYANVRPIKSLEGVKSKFANIDLVVIRENTEDLYTGEEYMKDDNTAIAIKKITSKASERIIRFAFDYARKNHRNKVTCVHKANIMKLSDGMFLDVFNRVSEEYYDIESENVIIDALCMKLVTNPQQFDILVAPNLYGDIISDLCAGLVGGLGFAPSVNVGDKVRIYEAVHGSAPDIAGQNKANPSAMLMAYKMLLEDHGFIDKAEILDTALRGTIKDGKHITFDIGGKSSTEEFTNALIERIQYEIDQ